MMHEIRGRFKHIFLALLVTISSHNLTTAYASPINGSFIPEEGLVFNLKLGGVLFTCAFKDGWIVGSLDLGNGIFTPTTLVVKKLKKKLKKKSGLKKIQAKKAYKAQKIYLSVGEKLCADNTEGQILPPPGVTPTPTVAPVTCFEPNGDAKPGCFGIPAPWVGNKVQGEIYSNNYCVGCHNPKANKTYQEVENAFNTVPQMAPFKPQVMQDFVDVVAYINRFSL